jgi:hypothetical protein
MRRELMDETDKGGVDFEKLKEIDQKRQAGILKKLYFVVEEPENSRLGSAISSFVMVLIILSIFALVGRDWPPARDNVPPKAWEITEYVCTTVFTIEYLVRLAVCTQASKEMTRIKFVFAPSNLCDILAILPSYIEFIPTDGDKPVYLRVLRVIRLSRILRLFKVMRNSPHMRVLQEGLRRSVQPLILLVILIFFGMIFFSSLMYYAERNYCNWSELDAICQLGPDCAWQFSDPCPWNTSVNGFGLRSVYQLPRATQDRNVCEVAVALLPELGEVPAECTDEARSALAAQACAVGVALDDAAALSGTEDYNLYQRDPDLASQTAWSRRNAAYERWNAFQVACAVGLGPLSYKSIGSTFWWTITSMTVVGYGDVYPQTLQGKLVGMMTLAFAPLLLALPMSIIVNQFQTVYNELQSRAPVNVSKLPLSSRLRAQLRTRWQARMELSESGLKKKEVIPGSPVKSGHSPSPRPKSRQSPGNSSPSIAGRLVPGSNAEDGDDRAKLTPPHSPSSRDDGKRPSLQLTVDDYKEDGEDCEQNPLLARVSVIEAKVAVADCSGLREKILSIVRVSALDQRTGLEQLIALGSRELLSNRRLPGCSRARSAGASE